LPAYKSEQVPVPQVAAFYHSVGFSAQSTPKNRGPGRPSFAPRCLGYHAQGPQNITKRAPAAPEQGCDRLVCRSYSAIPAARRIGGRKGLLTIASKVAFLLWEAACKPTMRLCVRNRP